MSKNSFQGQIPGSFGDMKSLETSSLSNNYLSGRILELLILVCPLEVLRFSCNNLQGPVFPHLFNLTELNLLQLSSNNLAKEIPEFSPLVIDISNNYFSGKLPRWMRKISSLNRLSLSKNYFEGPFSFKILWP
ncbi:hypothetical protein SLE2022_000150 [Rubroshorea leprosula]